MINIYTDGATSNNKRDEGYGGWAYIIAKDEGYVGNAGAVLNATNNICELMAIINGCEAALSLFPNDEFIIYSDSAYCINCYKQQWYKKWVQNNWKNSKKEPVANRELWEKLIPFFENKNFNFEKVKGHADNKYNNIVDKMAVEAKQCLM